MRRILIHAPVYKIRFNWPIHRVVIAARQVEEKILQLQDRKRALVNQLITNETSFFKSLTPDDVKVLFS